MTEETQPVTQVKRTDSFPCGRILRLHLLLVILTGTVVVVQTERQRVHFLSLKHLTTIYVSPSGSVILRLTL